jgi:hypothetical protein
MNELKNGGFTVSVSFCQFHVVTHKRGLIKSLFIADGTWKDDHLRVTDCLDTRISEGVRQRTINTTHATTAIHTKYWRAGFAA